MNKLVGTVSLKIKSFLELFKKGSFTKNIMMITGGTAFAQALNIIFSPIITRLYSPEDYGTLTVYVSILGMISLLGALSYDSAIPISKNNEKAFNLLVLCFIVLTFGTIVITLLLFSFGDEILVAFKANQIVKYKYYIPLGFFLTGLYTIMTKWALRNRDFKAITVTKFSQSITGIATKIIYGLISPTSIGLIFGNIFSQSAGIVTLTKPHINEFKKLLRSVKYFEVKALAKKHINFPLYTAPGLFVLSASGQLPTLFISSLFGPGMVGFYGLARSITFLPMTVIGNSVGDVFYGEAANLGKENAHKIKVLSNKLLRKLIVIGIIPMLVLFALGPILFSYVFGSDWEMAGSFSRLLTIEVFFNFIFHPISTIFSIFERQKTSFYLHLARLMIVLFVFGTSPIFNLSIKTTVLIYTISMALLELTKYLLAQKIMNEEIFRDIVR